MSAISQNCTPWIGIQSTVKMIFSFGAHHQGVVRMVLADVVELERRAAERDVYFKIDNLVRDDDVIRFECGDASLGILVGDKGRAKILEWLAASDVIEMAVAVNDVFDRALVTAWIAST